MSHYQGPPPDKDPELWKIAQRRAHFKGHLASYIIINAFFWVIWFFGDQHVGHTGLPWPVWPALGWGIGLIFHFLGAYVYPSSSITEREYEKLIRDKK